MKFEIKNTKYEDVNILSKKTDNRNMLSTLSMVGKKYREMRNRSDNRHGRKTKRDPRKYLRGKAI